MLGTASTHNKKAGNEGDVVKHVALIAAVAEVCRAATQSEFVYADLYDELRGT